MVPLSTWGLQFILSTTVTWFHNASTLAVQKNRVAVGTLTAAHCHDLTQRWCTTVPTPRWISNMFDIPDLVMIRTNYQIAVRLETTSGAHCSLIVTWIVSVSCSQGSTECASLNRAKIGSSYNGKFTFSDHQNLDLYRIQILSYQDWLSISPKFQFQY